MLEKHVFKMPRMSGYVKTFNPKKAGWEEGGGGFQFDPHPVAFRKQYLLKRG